MSFLRKRWTNFTIFKKGLLPNLNPTSYLITESTIKSIVKFTPVEKYLCYEEKRWLGYSSSQLVIERCVALRYKFFGKYISTQT